MYIEQYWGEYTGGTDDSLTLTAYLAGKHKKEITLEEIFSDFGAETLFGDFQNTDPPLAYTNAEGWEMGIQFAIDLAADLAVLLLECKAAGGVDLLEADDALELDPAHSRIQIIPTPEEAEQIKRILDGFIAAPDTFDISELEDGDTLREMAAAYKEIRNTLFG